MVEINIEAILPDIDIDPMGAAKELAAQIEEIAVGALEKFEQTVETWSTPVSFELEVVVGSEAILFAIKTDSELYDMVNEGTDPHVIEGDPLVFRDSYSAKTQPGILSSRQGGGSGGLVAARSVEHPGFEGRNFVKEVLKWVDSELKKINSEKIAKATRWS